ncbi:arylacetamide deacetylase-like 4 [Phaenicophaeus curvirostris]|uniref:arylacetamide deacetylase-like 4 n=1 Tax=Phaenicophaeus curvirostris TaxID=33595 RepID=UPI0037F0A8A3
MEFLLAVFLAVLTVTVAMSFYYEHPKAEIPHGISQRQKLYVFHYVLNFVLGLGKFLEKVGITSEISIIRTVMDGIPPFKDKHLFIKDLSFEKVNVRIYQPKISTTGQRRGILYFHGGVGQFGSIRAYERTCRFFARSSNSVVVSVGYRLAPEYPYPTQFEDCLVATIHFMKAAQDYGVDSSRITVCGDSSGGTLAAAVAQALVNRTDLPKLRAQILIYPFLQAVDFDLPSYQQNKGVPLLLKERTIAFGLKYLNKDLSDIKAVAKGCHVPEDLQLKYQKWVSADYIPRKFKRRGYKPSTTRPFSEELSTPMKVVFDPVFSPLLAEDSVIARLPETFILTCEFDVLRDDGLLYKKRLKDHGIKVTWCHLQEGFHGIILLAFWGRLIAFQSGNQGLEEIVNFLRLM